MCRPVADIVRDFRASTPYTPAYYRRWRELEEAVRRIGDRQIDIDRKVDLACEKGTICTP